MDSNIDSLSDWLPMSQTEAKPLRLEIYTQRNFNDGTK